MKTNDNNTVKQLRELYDKSDTTTNTKEYILHLIDKLESYSMDSVEYKAALLEAIKFINNPQNEDEAYSLIASL